MREEEVRKGVRSEGRGKEGLQVKEWGQDRDYSYEEVREWGQDRDYGYEEVRGGGGQDRDYR